MKTLRCSRRLSDGRKCLSKVVDLRGKRVTIDPVGGKQISAIAIYTSLVCSE
jgi:hypothetical protein